MTKRIRDKAKMRAYHKKSYRKHRERRLAEGRARYADNREREIARVRKWQDDNPEKARRWKDENPNAARECARLSYHRHSENRRAGNAKWYRENKEWAAAKNHERRALEVSVSDGTATVEFMRNLYAKRICYYCGWLTFREHRTADHKTPLSRGGLHSASNLVMACYSCNYSKGTKTEAEFCDA